MKKKGVLLILLMLMSPLAALFAKDIQLTTAFAYNPSIISDWSYGGAVSGLYSGDRLLTGAAVRYQKKVLNLSYQLTYDFGKTERTRYLTGGNITERHTNPFFLTLKGGFEYIPSNGWENIIGFQAGKLLGTTGKNNRVGLSLALGAYIHMSKAEGFRRIMVSFDPDMTLSVFLTLFQDIYANLSLITTMPYFYPKQMTYGGSFTLAYDICPYFTMAVDGYIFFTDMIGETEVFGRRELSVSVTARLPL